MEKLSRNELLQYNGGGLFALFRVCISIIGLNLLGIFKLGRR